MQKINISSTRTQGFTFVEMLVVITIMLIIAGGGIASFVRFNDKQQVQVAVSELQALMHSAQVKARVGEDASRCRTDFSQVLSLRSYRVEVQANSNVATLYAVCTNDKFAPTDEETIQISEQEFNSAIKIDDGSDGKLDIEFLSLLSGVDGYSLVRVRGNSNYTCQFEVKKSGEITIGAYVNSN